MEGGGSSRNRPLLFRLGPQKLDGAGGEEDGPCAGNCTLQQPDKKAGAPVWKAGRRGAPPKAIERAADPSRGTRPPGRGTGGEGKGSVRKTQRREETV